MNGRAFAVKIAKELGSSRYVITSGLAGGIDHTYPPEKLYEQIASDCLIIAELPAGTKPLGQHFPQRNRLISREVFAVPGFPLDPRSQGTNKLIKEGAILVESIEDIVHKCDLLISIGSYNNT